MGAVTDLLPDVVRPALDLFSERLAVEFARDLTGAYVHGSLALGDYRHGSSDIDFIVVLGRDVTAADRKRIDRLHRDLIRLVPEARLLEGMYLSREALRGRDVSRLFPYVKRGRLRRGGHRVGATARHMLREHGVALVGPLARELVPPVPSEDVVAEMDFNLNVYWAKKARQPLLYLFDAPVDFAVLTLPRILHTLETGTMISKGAAAELVDARYPQWRPLLADVRGRFPEGDHSRFPLGRIARAVATVRYIRAMIAEANRRHGLGPARV
jgi:predicted nucleotidyltransferase